MHAVSNKEMADAWVGFSRIELDVLNGKKSPKWDDFDRLDKLVSYLKRYKGDLSAASKLEQFTTDLQAIDKTLKDELQFQPDITAAGTVDVSAYLPGDYELRLIYRHYLNELNEMFPGTLMKLSPIPAPKFTKAELVAQAEDILAKRPDNSEMQLQALGAEFKSWDDYKTFIQKRADDTGEGSPARQILKLLEDDSSLSFRIRRPNRGRFWISKSGFQNQFVTGTSNGSLDPQWRINAEVKMLGVDPSYAQQDMGVRAKYGYMQFGESSPLQLMDGAEQYGDDIYVLKHDHMKNRATYTIGDSLGYTMGGSLPKGFGQFFIPASNFPYAMPFFTPVQGRAGFVSLNPCPQGINCLNWNGRYIEMQFFGPVDLDDVEEFVFTNIEPTGDFLKELQARNIKIKDGRVGFIKGADQDYYHPTDWTPPTTADPDYTPLIQRAQKGTP